MRLLNFTSPELVVAGLPSRRREDALRALVHRLVELGKVTEGDALLNDLIAREGLESTGIGRGLAIPHARSEAVVGSLVMIARLEEPIDWDALDGEPVDLLFLLAGARELPGQQLRVLARISKLVRIDAFIEALRGAETPADIIAALRRVEAKHF